MGDSRGPVLVVDDEPDIVEFLLAVLTEEGYGTASAIDGVEALKRVDEIKPALIILDLMMPRMTGFEVLDALEQRRLDPHPSIIVLSAKSTHQDILDALERGADDFMSKPFDLEDLLLRVRVWLDRARVASDHGSELRIFMLGPFRVFLGDTLLLDDEKGNSHLRLMLKYLVTECRQPAPRSQLLYLLWPDLDENSANLQLNDVLAEFARATGPRRYICEDGAGITLNETADIWVDAREFESQVRTAQDAQEAGDADISLGLFLSGLALYKADYLHDNLYEDWPSERRERLRELWISSMFRVAAICAERCEYADSVRLMKKILEIDPYRENAYQALMLYLSRAGRRSEAIQLFRYAERLFAQHLAAQPAPSTRMLYEKILRGEAG
ncbi:MAG: response regulator [Chloroflexota bacterium]